MGTVIHYAQHGNAARQQRWERMQRAELLDQYRDLQAQGVSQRQAAKVLAVPRTTLQAWRAGQDRLDICPQVGTFFASGPGLAYLHRLVMALHVVFVEIGACGIRLVCLFLQMTGLNRFVGASYETQQVNRRVEEAMVAYRQEESTRLAQERPAKDITLTQDETFTGGLCLVGIEPVSNWRSQRVGRREGGRGRPAPALAIEEQPDGVSSPASPAALGAAAAGAFQPVSARGIHGAAVHPRW